MSTSGGAGTLLSQSTIATYSVLGAPASLTAAPVSIDPYVVASRHETVFEGSQVKGARRRRCRDAQGGGREDLLCVDAHHKALDKEASRDRGRGARADPRQALQERSDA